MTAALAAADSDGDTFSNSAEITAGTYPGDASSHPSDTTRPSVTINQAVGQADPTSASPINFTAVFSETVTGFATGDVTIGGTAGATIAAVTGSGTTYNVAVSGMTSAGTVTLTIAANAAQDAAGNLNTASTSTDNTVNYTPPQPADDMAIWVGTWFNVTVSSEGRFVKGVGLTNDRQTAKGYLNISGWDPNSNIFQATLHYVDSETGQWASLSIPLNYFSGKVLNFRCWAHVVGDVVYGFTARIKGTKKSGVIVRGTFTTIGGYHARMRTSEADDEPDDDSEDNAGWLIIKGKVVSEANVPTDIP